MVCGNDKGICVGNDKENKNQLRAPVEMEGTSKKDGKVKL